MTVAGPESRVEERELSCIRFFRTVCRQQTEIVRQLNVDFSCASFDCLGTRSPPYDCIKFEYPLQNALFLLLSTNLAQERLQIDTDLLRIVASTADELCGVPTSMTLNDLEPQNRGF